MTKPKLYIGYVHPPMIPHRFMECLFIQVLDTTYDTVVHPYGSGPMISQGRNYLVEKFLESPCDWFLGVDTDVEWFPEQVGQLMAHDKDIVSGLYRSHTDAGVIWPVYLKMGPNGFYEKPTLDDIEGKTELMTVEAVGMGFILVKRLVFEKLGTSLLWPFAEIMGENGRYQGEDVTFCERAKEKGFEVFLDPTISVRHTKLLPV
jgi:GT2 family glycosyltransferase